jgi:methylmalonyl-CoA/ethylmalonyl-CoA epimerase
MPSRVGLSAVAPAGCTPPETQEGAVFTRIHHSALAVHRLEISLRFYRDLLGLPLIRQEVVATQGVTAALLAAGPDELELLEPVDPEGGVARYLRKRGEGLHHLCLETPDLGQALTALQAAQVPLLDQRPRPGLAGQIAFLHPAAAHGVLVELAQPDAPRHPVCPSTGIQVRGVRTVYLGAKEPAAATETFRRTCGAVATGSTPAACFGAAARLLQLGASQLTLVDARQVEATHPGTRAEGLFGLGLVVADLAQAVGALLDRGVPLATRNPEGVQFLACAQTGGVALSLSQV